MAKYNVLKKEQNDKGKYVYTVEITDKFKFKHKNDLTPKQIDDYVDSILPDREVLKQKLINKLKEEYASPNGR